MECLFYTVVIQLKHIELRFLLLLLPTSLPLQLQTEQLNHNNLHPILIKKLFLFLI